MQASVMEGQGGACRIRSRLRRPAIVPPGGGTAQPPGPAAPGAAGPGRGSRGDPAHDLFALFHLQASMRPETVARRREAELGHLGRAAGEDGDAGDAGRGDGEDADPEARWPPPPPRYQAAAAGWPLATVGIIRQSPGGSDHVREVAQARHPAGEPGARADQSRSRRRRAAPAPGPRCRRSRSRRCTGRAAPGRAGRWAR